jgi:hypothetical protein
MLMDIYVRLLPRIRMSTRYLMQFDAFLRYTQSLNVFFRVNESIFQPTTNVQITEPIFRMTDNIWIKVKTICT